MGNPVSSIKLDLSAWKREGFKTIFAEEPILELSLEEKGNISLGEKCGAGVSRPRIITFKNKRGTKVTAFRKLSVVGRDRTESVGTDGGWQVWCAMLRYPYLIPRARGDSEGFKQVSGCLNPVYCNKIPQA